MEQAIRFGEAEYGDSNEWVKARTQKDEMVMSIMMRKVGFQKNFYDIFSSILQIY